MDRTLNIFFDLDETLVQSLKYDYWTKEISRKGLTWAKVDRYTTVLRPIAKSMLAYARMRGNVYALTQGSADYFFEINKKLGLGFNSLSAYTYEDIYLSEQRGLNIFKGKKNILIDNLSYKDQVEFTDDFEGYGSKIKFLDGLKKSHYYHIPNFGWGNNFDDEQDILMDVQAWIEKFVK